MGDLVGFVVGDLVGLVVGAEVGGFVENKECPRRLISFSEPTIHALHLTFNNLFHLPRRKMKDHMLHFLLI